MSLFKISIISSLFLHCVVFFLLKNLEINNEKNENLDLQIVSQIITKNMQEPVAPEPPAEPIALAKGLYLPASIFHAHNLHEHGPGSSTLPLVLPSQ